MSQIDLFSVFAFSRKRLSDLLDKLAQMPDCDQILAWRPGPGRAHIAWQFMHLAATDDRHLNVRMRSGEPAEAEYVRRFAGGSTPDDDIPTIAEIRKYLTERREALVAHLKTLTAEQWDQKPTPDAQWTYREWIQLLAWHEGHHHGQAHITYNLFRAQHPLADSKLGH